MMRNETAPRTHRVRRQLGMSGGWALGFLAIVGAIVSGPGCGSDGGSPVDPQPPDPTPYPIEIPESFPIYQEPANNKTTIEGVALGRRLFHDRVLSGDRTQSCADCHQQAFGFTDEGRRFSLGIDGLEGDRNTPAIFNSAWTANLFWDGRVTSLEDQAREPVRNPIEMHADWDEAVARVAAERNYPPLFAAAFGDREVTQDRILKAIAQFERTLISGNSKYDQWLQEKAELTESEERGLEIFFTEEGDCFHCHGNILFTDTRFHDIGLDLAPADSGRSHVTKNPADFGLFKTPSLRNIEYTAPYMHDGRFQTLDEVLDHYDLNVNRSTNLDPLILARMARGPALDEQDRIDLIAFLKTLSDPSFLTDPDHSNPFE